MAAVIQTSMTEEDAVLIAAFKEFKAALHAQEHKEMARLLEEHEILEEHEEMMEWIEENLFMEDIDDYDYDYDPLYHDDYDGRVF